ncbi:MAG: hypothetical protein FGM15_12510 [Chthoniobacterales bacterium]|nr:hypothetical protein [Chthoniobacterales bacterium]
MNFRPAIVLVPILLASTCLAADPDPAVVADLRSCWQISSRPLVNLGQDVSPEALLCFRKTFDLPELAQMKEAWAVFAADDAATLFLNGTEIGSAQQGTNPDFTAKYGTFAIPLELLKEKDNVLAVRLTNSPQTPAGIIGKITFVPEQGEPRFLPMDTTWKWVEGEPAEGWMEAGFDDAAWSPAVAVQPNSQTIGLVGYAPPVPEKDFPEFIVPGQEKWMTLMRDFYNRHLNWFFTCGTLWDPWIPRTVAWPALADDVQGRPQFQAARQYLSLRELTPEGYISTHQHYGLGHPKGWPFPMWSQSAGKGWHFSLAFVPYRDPFGIFLTTSVDDWTLEDCTTVSLGEPEGWVLETGSGPATITSPKIDVAKRSATYVRMEWLAPQLSPQAQPYLEWTTDGEPEFSPQRRVYFSPPARDARIPVVSMIKLPEHIDLETRITRLRIGFGNSAPGRITIKAIMTSVETRHNINNPSYILGVADYTAWSGDLNLLRESMPKMRAALAYFLKKYRVREEKMVVTPDIGKDGRSGFAFTPDGTKVVTPGRGIGNNYFDILPFGGRDANATYLAYAAILRMADLEEQIAAHPEWNIDRGALAFDPDDLRKLAAEVKTTAAPFFFNDATGRFVGAEDLVDKKRYDYGFVFINNEAIYYDFAQPDQAVKIRDWLDGKRVVEGDTSQGADIYKYRFGPRMTTRRNLEWYIFPWFNPENIPWGGQVQDGGSVLGFSYHDLMAILKVRGPAAAWQRLREILQWYEDTQKAGGYVAYYSGKKENEEGSMQGGGIGSGGLGIMREFQESLLLPQVMIDGFLGLRPRMDGLAIRPSLPKDWPSLTITRIGFQGGVYSITAKSDGSISVECTAGELAKPALLFPPDGTWQDAAGNTFSPRAAAEGIPLPAKPGESLTLTPWRQAQ